MYEAWETGCIMPLTLHYAVFWQVNREVPREGQAVLVMYADTAYMGQVTKQGELLYCKKAVCKLDSKTVNIGSGQTTLGREYAKPCWDSQLVTNLPFPKYEFKAGKLQVKNSDQLKELILSALSLITV